MLHIKNTCKFALFAFLLSRPHQMSSRRGTTIRHHGVSKKSIIHSSRRGARLEKTVLSASKQDSRKHEYETKRREIIEGKSFLHSVKKVLTLLYLKVWRRKTGKQLRKWTSICSVQQMTWQRPTRLRLPMNRHLILATKVENSRSSRILLTRSHMQRDTSE